MRCPGKRVGREHHDEIDRQRFPLDAAEIGDLGRDVAAKHVDGHGVAELQAEFASLLRGKGDQRFARIVLAPPLAFRKAGVLRLVLGIGDAAVAA